MIAAVARIFQPGIKFDQALILEGPQGFNKSSLIKALAGPEWFTDALTVQAKNQVVIEQTAGKWLVELAELSGLRPSKVEHVKAFLSQSTDSARLAYRHDSVERPRQFILIGTVNDAEYLTDKTGNRRFWPVRVREFFEFEIHSCRS